MLYNNNNNNYNTNPLLLQHYYSLDGYSLFDESKCASVQ